MGQDWPFLPPAWDPCNERRIHGRLFCTCRTVEVAPGKWKIDKSDERGRTVDVHALRHTFGTLLSAAGVAPRTAQAAMRHSTIDLTMNVYTDPKLLDVAGAMDALPVLSLTATAEAVRATGTDDATASQFAPGFAPTSGKPCTLRSIVDKAAGAAKKSKATDAVAASACPVKQNNPLTTGVNGLCAVEPKGIEPSTSWMQTRRSPN